MHNWRYSLKISSRMSFIQQF